MKSIYPTLAVAFSASLLNLTAYAQTTSGTQNGQAVPPAQSAQPAAGTPSAAPDRNRQSKLTQEDQAFLENAIQGSHAEIEGSRLALEKTKSQDVRQFAEKMIEDHGKMVDEASALATTKDMTPPDGPSVMQMTEVTALKALTGGAFDAMYVNRIGVAAHETTVEMFEKASREAQDPDVKAMATKVLPKLREHLEMARALDQKQESQ